MSATHWRRGPSPLQEVPVLPDVREKETEEIEEKVEFYERVRSNLNKGSASSAYGKAKDAWKKYIDKVTWKNHGLITRRLEEAYLSARARLDIMGNNAKESATVGFFELWLKAEFSEKRFFLKSQFGVSARKGPEEQVDDLLGYMTHYMLQQPLVMIEAKRHPKGREYMTPGELTALENQVEGYCRQWLKDNPDIHFLYAVTCASTEMRFWIMERNRDMERAKMVGLWEPKKRTWAEYRDPGLNCDAKIIKAAINLIKDNPNGSDAAITTASESQSQSDGAPHGISGKATGGTSGSKRRTPSEDRRGDRNRSRDGRGDKSDQQPSSQEETPEERAERHKRRERAKESERRGEEKGKGKVPRRSERGDSEKDRGGQRETSEKPRSLHSSAPIKVPGSSSRGDSRRANTSIDDPRNLASSSSPEHGVRIPIRGPRRERVDTDKSERASIKDGKRVEASSSHKSKESRKPDSQGRKDSLSTVPSTSSDDRNSSSSDNRAPRHKSTKKVGDASADVKRSKRDKPAGSG
ncbi:uncharacterized protein Bfra_007654 [Botrytis fragariae]|uniref:Uncharacterized protein n=1 Tax=Botrytis fragariae TaxID=1964551 RepID=A0A8H6EGK8_9HELO|nr:uncharacterized protein Bfra_007654 [Botrytis fragariae]KAF5871140.1 hypothetical protein Bfra_007654 [Botrytis fragariae]